MARWRDRLRAASFRGVAFETDGDDLQAGRRIQVHEYPQRDKPFSEDLGRASREFAVTAFVIGPDFMARRDQLLAALEQAGPGTLVHPFYGSLQVTARPARVSHSNAEGGMARFELAFVEAGELTFPSAGTATDQKVRLAADNMTGALQRSFSDSFSTTGPALLSTSAVSQATALLTSARQRIAEFTTGVNAQVTTILGYVSGGKPDSLGTAVVGLYNDLVGVAELPARTIARLTNAIPSPLSRYLRASSALVGIANAVPSKASAASASSMRQTEAANTNAMRELFRGSALAASATTLSLSALPVYDDAIAMRTRLCSALDAMASSTADDALFGALQDLRIAVYEDVATRTRDTARLVAYTPPDILPAVVIAYDWYEDASREIELVDRNRIRHPGFVPPAPLWMLSR